MTIEFEYNLGDKILVKELQRPGIVMCVSVDNLGISYQIRYWDNATREIVWLFSDEIELRKPISEVSSSKLSG